MELYYKDLISEEASLEKLVDDLMLVVQGAQELAAAAGASLETAPHAEVATRLQRLRDNCQRLKDQAVNTALAADKLMHQYPYSALGFSFAAGLGIGALLKRCKG